MPTLTISLSDEEVRRLENLSEREGLAVEQLVRLCVRDLITQPDEFFQIAAKRVI
jgi:predicted DNA-binding protein